MKSDVASGIFKAGYWECNKQRLQKREMATIKTVWDSFRSLMIRPHRQLAVLKNEIC